MKKYKTPSVRRAAVIRSVSVTADCPIEATCVCVDDEHNRKVICGHYQGSITTGKGSAVLCEYRGE